MSPTAYRTQALQTAIQKASPERLREVITALCAANPDAQTFLEEKLLVAVAQVKVPAPSKRGRAATTARWERCVQCEKEFDVLANGPEACRWHPGDLEADEDSDVWADWDEPCHGPMESEENKKEFPHAFFWECCEANGAAGEYCEVGPHMSNDDIQREQDLESTVKRQRVG